ncbi:MAG: hypothetical protein K9H64_11250 [Bacteroidales bacterium]|nr:hypothetical protein [Bacteroidales bacterium]MCF8456527.1 hypothetical protein [Bacteroidales bacterium]
MNKRIAALFFILLANITLLALAVIPHHHHETEICVVPSHCDEEGEIHDHDVARHDHEHDGESKTQYCVLNQVYVVPSKEFNSEIKCLDKTNNSSTYTPFQAVLLNVDLISFDTKCLAKEKPPLLFWCYLQRIQTSCGMRAPPHA